MAATNSPENGYLETRGKRRGLGLKRAIVLIKDISILGVIFYLVYFVAASIIYRNEQNVLLSFIYRLSNTAYGIASSLVVYAIAHIIDQYKKEE
jgi:ABC-type multidrug transport system permease subunit